MRRLKFLVLISLVAGLISCNKPSEPPDVIKPQRDALDKAKGVEQTLQKHADDTRTKIEDAENR